jgi:hypothetical protein
MKMVEGEAPSERWGRPGRIAGQERASHMRGRFHKRQCIDSIGPGGLQPKRSKKKTNVIKDKKNRNGWLIHFEFDRFFTIYSPPREPRRHCNLGKGTISECVTTTFIFVL